jgi:hypothetical protein
MKNESEFLISFPLGPNLAVNLVSAIFILASAAVPLYLSTKLHGVTRKLTIILSAFILIHGFFHICVILNLVLLGQGFLSPLSVLVLAYFGVTYLRVVRKGQHTER